MSRVSGSANIKVVGVGGGGSNAINRMIEEELKGVEFFVINTDIQALSISRTENRIQIGERLTNGLGSGGNPLIGEKAAIDSRELIKASLEGADMIFITTGMGGGTGTGATPIIAEICRELGALTIAILTKPFKFEGAMKMKQAEIGISKLKKNVDSLLTIPNDRLLSVIQKNTTMQESFKLADEILKQGIQSIYEIINISGLVNVDFADVKSIMSNSGSAVMGIGKASGENRAIQAAELAIQSKLLENKIEVSTDLIVNITGGNDLSLLEVNDAINVIKNSLKISDNNIIFGAVIDKKFEGKISITIIATSRNIDNNEKIHKQKHIIDLELKSNLISNSNFKVIRSIENNITTIVRENHINDEKLNKKLPGFIEKWEARKNKNFI